MNQQAPTQTWPATPVPRLVIDPVEQVRRAEADPARPRWHVTPPWGWLNDPNGLTVQPGPQGEDVIHLFYQHNPSAPVHDLIQWGHAVSTDLVHWRDLPVALRPTSGGPDALGCWSGVVVDGLCGRDAEAGAAGQDGPTRPVMVYSGASDRATQTACLARPVPGDPWLTHWLPDPASPVVDAAPASTDGLVVPEMRDHCLWREDGRWLQVMGSGLRAQDNDGLAVGAALCFSSDDLLSWTYEGVLAQGDGDLDGSGTVWECPELTRLGDTDLLCVSAWHEGRTMRSTWMTGRREGARMSVGLSGVSDHGEHYFYAPQSLWMPDGRRVMIGWMQPATGPEACIEAGWAGSMSVPREVSLAADGTLRLRPVAEVELLREKLVAQLEAGADESQEGGTAETPTGDADRPAPPWVRGRFLDIEMSARVTQDRSVVMDLYASLDGERRTRLSVSRRESVGDSGQDAWTGWVCLDRTRSAAPGSMWAGAQDEELSGPVPLGPDGEVSLRLLLDASSLEVFVGGQPLSARVSTDPADDAVLLRSLGAGGASMRAWSMGEAYPQGRARP